MLNDIAVVNDSYLEQNKRRMDYFIPSYLHKYIRKSDEIFSMGCGTGYDVELLNNLGFDAYGIDPGNRIKDWGNRPIEIQNKLRYGISTDFPFKDKKFDFIYSLEVIEHVGCKDGNWMLLKNSADLRLRFIESCLDMLKPEGRLLITTSNRLSPEDFGHGHHYSKLTNFFGKSGLNVTLPWHNKNFLVSFNDLKEIINSTSYLDRYEISQESSYGYPSNSNGKHGRMSNYLVKIFLRTMSTKPLIRLNPILVVQITRTEESKRTHADL